MYKTILLSVIGLLAAVPFAAALEITAVAPSRGIADTRVVVSGGPFSPQSRLFLGEQLVTPGLVLPNRLEFSVPPLPAGSYSLTVQDDNDMVLQPFNFEVLAAPPQIVTLAPDNLDFCTDESDRLVEIGGRDFQPGARVLLNGSATNSRVIDADRIEFRLPELPAGVYGVEVRNPDGAASLPHSLWVNSVPEIVSVERGDDFVNYYEMVVRGKNFFYNSILVVSEPESAAIGRTDRLLTFHAGQGDAASMRNLRTMPGEKLIYGDCRTLVYHRYPSNPQEKELTLQVINPDGKKTGPYLVTMP